MVKNQSNTKENIEDIRIPPTKPDMDKYREVLLYILNTVGAKPNIGETVLHKLLYFIDFDYYEKYEEALIGEQYIKNHHGPTSKNMKSIIESMVENKEIEVVQGKHFEYEQKKCLPLRKPDLSILSAQEVQHIDGVLDRLSDKTAKYLSEYSHKDLPWMSTDDRDTIDYELVFYRNDTHSVKEYDDEL